MGLRSSRWAQQAPGAGMTRKRVKMQNSPHGSQARHTEGGTGGGGESAGLRGTGNRCAQGLPGLLTRQGPPAGLRKRRPAQECGAMPSAHRRGQGAGSGGSESATVTQKSCGNCCMWEKDCFLGVTIFWTLLVDAMPRSLRVCQTRVDGHGVTSDPCGLTETRHSLLSKAPRSG